MWPACLARQLRERSRAGRRHATGRPPRRTQLARSPKRGVLGPLGANAPSRRSATCLMLGSLWRRRAGRGHGTTASARDAGVLLILRPGLDGPADLHPALAALLGEEAAAQQDDGDRLQQDPQVAEQADVAHVLLVELDQLGAAQLVAAADRPQAGQAGAHAQRLRVAAGVALDDLPRLRPRPDQRHLAAQHVHELRQLVQRRRAQHPADRRDPRSRWPRPSSRRRGARCRCASCGT